jgi:protein-tyrosine phosphatase
MIDTEEAIVAAAETGNGVETGPVVVVHCVAGFS